MNARLTSAKGGAIRLASELGRGGEGSVFGLVDHPEFVAKLYHSQPDRLKAEKLVAMANGCTERLRDVSAWPIDTIHDVPSGAVRGFVMRRVAGQKDIHVLYGPKTRLRDYPDATYRFLVHVAANLARAFAVVHDHGHVIGDVNQGGVCVSTQGTVTLVDCDSFQVRGSQRTYGCDVGIPIYQPPELQGISSFRGLPRTPNHDNFGLAVLIFQTLFLARHPFAGAFQGDGDMPIEQAIREYRFVYGRDAARRQMRQPPGSLGLDSVPREVGVLFERAFLEAGSHGGRPAPLEWVTALDGFLSELRECAQNSGHAHARSLPQCPLCEVEGRARVLLFLPQQQANRQAAPVNIEDLWRELLPIIASARVPAVSYAGVPAVAPPDAVLEFKQRKSRARAMVWLAIAAAVLLAFAWVPGTLACAFACPVIYFKVRGRPPAEALNVTARLGAAQERFDAVLRQLARERATSPLQGLESRAEALYRGLRDFPQRRSERLRRLERCRLELQMRRFLDQFEIRDARLKSFGPSLHATLLSNGIETAEDVTAERLRGIHGFGPKRIAKLLEWRQSKEAAFKFNPRDPADAVERIRVERELQLEYGKEVAELQRLAEEIRARAGPLRQHLAALAGELDRAQQELAVGHATAVALGRAA